MYLNQENNGGNVGTWNFFCLLRLKEPHFEQRALDINLQIFFLFGL